MLLGGFSYQFKKSSFPPIYLCCIALVIMMLSPTKSTKRYSDWYSTVNLELNLKIKVIATKGFLSVSYTEKCTQ